jgi:hypothetical protein
LRLDVLHALLIELFVSPALLGKRAQLALRKIQTPKQGDYIFTGHFDFMGKAAQPVGHMRIGPQPRGPKKYRHTSVITLITPSRPRLSGSRSHDVSRHNLPATTPLPSKVR